MNPGHEGSSVDYLLVGNSFWSLDVSTSPFRVVRNQQGVVCLSGGLTFDSLALDEQVIVVLEMKWRPVFTSKHPVVCEVIFSYSPENV